MHHGQGCKQRKDVNKASTFLSSFFFRYDFFLLQLDDKIAEDSRDILHDNISMIICKRYTKGVVDVRIPLFPILQLGSE